MPHKLGFTIEGTTIKRIDNRGLLQGPNHVIHATATYFRIAQAFIRSLVAGNTLKHHQVTLPRTCLEHLYQGLNVEGSLLQVPIGSYGASGPSASGTTVTLGGECYSDAAPQSLRSPPRSCIAVSRTNWAMERYRKLRKLRRWRGLRKERCQQRTSSIVDFCDHGTSGTSQPI